MTVDMISASFNSLIILKICLSVCFVQTCGSWLQHNLLIIPPTRVEPKSPEWGAWSLSSGPPGKVMMDLSIKTNVLSSQLQKYESVNSNLLSKDSCRPDLRNLTSSAPEADLLMHSFGKKCTVISQQGTTFRPSEWYHITSSLGSKTAPNEGRLQLYWCDS